MYYLPKFVIYNPFRTKLSNIKVQENNLIYIIINVDIEINFVITNFTNTIKKTPFSDVIWNGVF